VRGWTKTVRPPASYTDQLKGQQKSAYGEANVPDSQLEEDHLIALGSAGHPATWPTSGPNHAPVHTALPTKDREEDTLQPAVRSGQMSLANAQATMRSDWTH
jgi:hypothetical protein